MTREQAEKFVAAFQANDEMENTRWYLAEGRRYAGLTEEALNSAWLAAWRDSHIHLTQDGRDRYDDVCAELRLRALALPEHLIDPVERERGQARACEGADRPDVKARMEEDMRRFQEELARPTN
jgi:hypothetical protein